MTTRYRILVYLAVAAVGCTTTRHRELAEFPAASGRRAEPAPMSATYTVKARAGADRRFDAIPDARVFVTKGTPLGFERTPTAAYALAGDVRIELVVEDDATLKWTGRTKRPTRLATAMRAFGRDAVRVGVPVLIDAALIGIEIALESDDVYCDPPKRRHH